MDEFMGIPIPKGDMLEKTKANAKWIEALSDDKKRKIENYFWIAVSIIACVIVFSAGFLVGFERTCAVVERETQNLCREYICENYQACDTDGNMLDYNLNISTPSTYSTEE